MEYLISCGWKKATRGALRSPLHRTHRVNQIKMASIAQSALFGVAVTSRVQAKQAKRNVAVRAGKYDDELLETAVSKP